MVRWDEVKATKNQQRLERVAREAVMQCRRAWVPVVHPVVAFEDVARLSRAAADLGGASVSLDHPVVLVGPEGGWTDAERAIDLPVVALSEAVLRAETAAITAGALLAARAISTTDHSLWVVLCLLDGG